MPGKNLENIGKSGLNFVLILEKMVYNCQVESVSIPKMPSRPSWLVADYLFWKQSRCNYLLAGIKGCSSFSAHAGPYLVLFRALYCD